MGLMQLVVVCACLNMVVGFIPSTVVRSSNRLDTISVAYSVKSTPEMDFLEQRLTRNANQRDAAPVKAIPSKTVPVTTKKAAEPVAAKVQAAPAQAVSSKPILAVAKTVVSPTSSKVQAAPVKAIDSKAALAPAKITAVTANPAVTQDKGFFSFLSRPADLAPVGVTNTVKLAPVMQKAAPAVQKAAPVVQKAISVAPSSPATLGTNDIAAGLGLGFAPFVIIPAILFSSLKSLIKPAKPLPVPVAAKVTKGAYIKSFAEGSKEGLKEFFSGGNTPENELAQKTLKLSGAGFGSAVLLSAILLTTSGGVKEVAKKSVSPAPIVKSVQAPKVQANLVADDALKKAAVEKASAEKAIVTAAAEKTGLEYIRMITIISFF